MLTCHPNTKLRRPDRQQNKRSRTDTPMDTLMDIQAANLIMTDTAIIKITLMIEDTDIPIVMKETKSQNQTSDLKQIQATLCAD